MSTFYVVVSLAIAVPYGFISFFILQGLVRQHQLASNALGVATAMIFFSCAVGHAFHGLHALHAGHQMDGHAVVPPLYMVLWDLGTAVAATWYLSLRRRYGQLLRGPAMFDDLNRIAEERRALHAATHDDLTGLANRARLLATVSDRLDPAHGSTAVVVTFVDLDGFKAVNDTCGHQAGDELLRAAADRLRLSVRAEDLPGRLGGDEFVVLFRDITLEIANAVTDRLIADLARPFASPKPG